MKPVIGKNLVGRMVVSTNGLHLGEVLDAYFETGGELLSLVVRPDREVKELDGYLDANHLLDITFDKVQAIGRYVIVDFPSAPSSPRKR